MDARLQVAEFQRILNKTAQAYRIRLQLMEKRNLILNQIAKNKEGFTAQLQSNLLNVLNREKKVIEIILSEDELERRNIDIAISILKKIKKSPAILAALKDKGIEYSKLKIATEFGFEILKTMSKRLKDIEKRIKFEEILISKPTQKNFEKFLDMWHKEIQKEEKLRNYIQFGFKESGFNFKRLAMVESPVVAIFGGLPLTDLSSHGTLLYGIGVALGLALFAYEIFKMASQDQYKIDIQSRNILRSVKERQI
jgi:hypothetical protein